MQRYNNSLDSFQCCIPNPFIFVIASALTFQFYCFECFSLFWDPLSPPSGAYLFIVNTHVTVSLVTTGKYFFRLFFFHKISVPVVLQTKKTNHRSRSNRISLLKNRKRILRRSFLFICLISFHIHHIFIFSEYLLTLMATKHRIMPLVPANAECSSASFDLSQFLAQTLIGIDNIILLDCPCHLWAFHTVSILYLKSHSFHSMDLFGISWRWIKTVSIVWSLLKTTQFKARTETKVEKV